MSANGDSFAACIPSEVTEQDGARFIIEAMLEVMRRAQTIDPQDEHACFHLQADYQIAWHRGYAPDPEDTAGLALGAIDFLTRHHELDFPELRAVLDRSQLADGRWKACPRAILKALRSAIAEWETRP